MTDRLSGPIRIGVVSEVAGFRVIVTGDDLMVRRRGEVVARETVPGLGRFVTNSKQLAVGWARLPNDDDIIYVYDRQDQNFGRACNIQDPWCSEWGYAPFPVIEADADANAA